MKGIVFLFLVLAFLACLVVFIEANPRVKRWHSHSHSHSHSHEWHHHHHDHGGWGGYQPYYQQQYYPQQQYYYQQQRPWGWGK
ncbi:unnamed protein product, partial [Mesorhabditis belari]|uniref:Uncharacterized protein n=1 Tax=Mesorhabditis belari TaxID=2138241 RepID=A0AAF3EXJ7_9BILA